MKTKNIFSKRRNSLLEMAKSICVHPRFSFPSLCFSILPCNVITIHPTQKKKNPRSFPDVGCLKLRLCSFPSRFLGTLPLHEVIIPPPTHTCPPHPPCATHAGIIHNSALSGAWAPCQTSHL